MTLRGYQLAVEMLNQKGGVEGRKFKLVVYDNQSDPGVTTRLYRKLIYEDQADFLLGPYSSTLTRPATPLAEQAEIPMVTTESADVGIWKGQNLRWVTQLLTPLERYNDGLHALAQQRGVDKIAYAYVNEVAPVATAKVDREKFRNNGIEVPLFERYQPEQVDFESLASKAKNTGADFFVLNGYFQDAASMAKALNAVGYHPELKWLGFTVVTSDFVDSAGDLAYCISGSSNWLPALETKGFIANNEEFVGGFKEKYGTDPDYRGAAAFGGVELLAEAMKASLDQKGEIDKKLVRDHIFTAQTQTVFGPYQVVAEGADAGMQTAASSVAIQWQEDPKTGEPTLEVLWPDEQATVQRPCRAT